MARKKKNTKKDSFEGKQYRGGRKSGAKNLVKADGGYINQHGVFFTEQEKKALKTAVDTANRKRARMLKTEATLPRMIAGKDTGETVGAGLHTMGSESDFILARKSKSLQRFKRREDYERYMANLQRVNSRDYIKERVALYKENHIKALGNVFGADADDVVAKIEKMSTTKYMKMVQSDEMLEIGYVYDPSALAGKLNQIRASLGMKLKEEPMGYDSV